MRKKQIIHKCIATCLLLIVSININADKFFIQILEIVGADSLMVDGRFVKTDSRITEGLEWTWEGAEKAIVYYTPLEGEYAGQQYITSKSIMEQHENATTLQYENFAGLGINDFPDAFILYPNKDITLHLDTEENATYYIEINNESYPLIKYDTTVVIPYNILEDVRESSEPKKYLIKSSKPNNKTGRLDNQIEGSFSFFYYTNKPQ